MHGAIYRFLANDHSRPKPTWLLTFRWKGVKSRLATKSMTKPAAACRGVESTSTAGPAAPVRKATVTPHYPA